MGQGSTECNWAMDPIAMIRTSANGKCFFSHVDHGAMMTVPASLSPMKVLKYCLSCVCIFLVHYITSFSLISVHTHFLVQFQVIHAPCTLNMNSGKLLSRRTKRHNSIKNCFKTIIFISLDSSFVTLNNSLRTFIYPLFFSSYSCSCVHCVTFTK